MGKKKPPQKKAGEMPKLKGEYVNIRVSCGYNFKFKPYQIYYKSITHEYFENIDRWLLPKDFHKPSRTTFKYDTQK